MRHCDGCKVMKIRELDKPAHTVSIARDEWLSKGKTVWVRCEDKFQKL